LRRLILILLVLAVAAGGIYLYQNSQAQAQTDTPAESSNIRSAFVDRGDLLLAVNASGSVVSERSVRLTFDTPGFVREVLVEPGQRVSAGDVLVRQDDTAQQFAVTQAESGLQAAELALESLLSPPDEDQIEVAQAQVRAAEGALNALYVPFSAAAIRAAELALQQAQQVYQDAIQRTRDTGGQFPTDSEQYQLALAQEGQAGFAVQAAQLQLDALRRGPDGRAVAAAQAQVEAARARVEQLRAGTPQAQIDQAQLTVEQARLALEQARTQLSKTVLTAPFDGTVTTVNATVGTLSANVLPAVILTDTDALYIDLSVDEVDIGQLREGQAVELTLDALPEATLRGEIDRIGILAEQGNAVTTYKVRVVLDRRNPAVKVGMSANATITVREIPNALRVPNLYVRLDRRTNQAFVNLVNPDRSLTEIEIVLGLRTEEYSEVISGLQEGDEVGIDLDGGGFDLFN
jgi:HlyD family secretion protein